MTATIPTILTVALVQWARSPGRSPGPSPRDC
jgi:hypothetical protein